MKQGFTLGHVHLKVRDIDRAIGFYTNLLGLRVTERVGRYVFLTYGQRHHEVALHEVDADAPPPDRKGVGLYHFAIELPNTEALKTLCKRLEAAEVPVKPVDHGISKVLYFSDPDDNGVEAYVDTRVANNRFEWRQESVPLDIHKLPDDITGITMRKIAISIAVGIIGLALSIFVGVYSESITEGVFLGSFSALAVFVIGMLVDIRLNQARLPADPDLLVASYAKLKNGPCELARVISESKYKELSAFFGELQTGRITLTDLNSVFAVLRPLFCDIRTIKEIYATSFGELTEWTETESWWAKNYMSMNAEAIKRGVKIKRIFILNDVNDLALGMPLFRRHLSNHVAVRTALRQTVSGPDFNMASNCLLFYDDGHKAIYCLQAIHGSDGGFVSAFLYSDSEHVKSMLDAYRRIETVSQPVALS